MSWLTSYFTCSLWLVWNDRYSDQYSKQFGLNRNVIFLGYVFIIIVKGHFCSPSLSFPIAIFTIIFCTVCLVLYLLTVCMYASMHVNTCTPPHFLTYTHNHFTWSSWLILHHRVLFLKLPSILYFSFHDGAKPLQSWYLRSSSKSLFQLSLSFPQFLFYLDYHILRNVILDVYFQHNSLSHDHISSLCVSMLDNYRHNIVQTIRICVMVLENNCLCFGRL
jgi:hypothetical protein